MIEERGVEERRVAASDGVELAVWEWGADRGQAPILAVHGLASNARLWDGLARRLADAGHHVVAVDQRGHGRSAKVDTGYDFATLAADLVAVADATGLERPVAVGQSWGGNVVLELAARHPERVRGIVCIDGGTIELASRFPGWEAARQALTPPRLAGMRSAQIAAGLRGRHPQWSDEAIAGQLANFEHLPDGTIRPWLTLERHLTILAALWDHHPSQRYAEVPVPVLLIPVVSPADGWGDAKRASVETAEHALPRVRTAWFRGDHDIHAEDPAGVADALLTAVGEGFFA